MVYRKYFYILLFHLIKTPTQTESGYQSNFMSCNKFMICLSMLNQLALQGNQFEINYAISMVTFVLFSCSITFNVSFFYSAHYNYIIPLHTDYPN